MTTQSTGKSKYLNFIFKRPHGEAPFTGSPLTSLKPEEFENTSRKIASRALEGIGINIPVENTAPSDPWAEHLGSVMDDFNKAVRSELKRGEAGRKNLSERSTQVMEALIAAAQKEDLLALEMATAEMLKESKKRKTAGEGSHSVFKQVYHAVTNTFEEDPKTKKDAEQKIIPKKGAGDPAGKDEQLEAGSAAAWEQVAKDMEAEAEAEQLAEEKRQQMLKEIDKSQDDFFASERKRRARKCRRRKFREANPYYCSNA